MFICAEAADVGEALELATQHKPHVAVVAVSLPLLKGLEVNRGIRRGSPLTQVLALSSQEREDLISMALAAGAQSWRFQLVAKTVEITTEVTDDGYSGWLNQGAPEFLGTFDDGDTIAHAFNLAPEDLMADLPMEVVSTGLRYLIVPVRPSALARARITQDITGLLHGANAQFAVLLDEAAVEVRHWNNDGIIEDVATGSAAGTIGAYRLRHAMAHGGQTFLLHQGQFTGRPSELRVRPEGSANQIRTVNVGGDVSVVGHGTIDALP